MKNNFLFHMPDRFVTLFYPTFEREKEKILHFRKLLTNFKALPPNCSHEILVKFSLIDFSKRESDVKQYEHLQHYNEAKFYIFIDVKLVLNLDKQLDRS